MSLAIENVHLIPLITFLEGLPLRTSASRARTRLVAALQQAAEHLAVAEHALVAEYAVVGEDGQPLISEDGSFTLANPETAPEFLAERTTLLGEKTILGDIPAYEGHLEQLTELLTNLDKDLSGQDALIYDALLCAIEEAQ